MPRIQKREGAARRECRTTPLEGNKNYLRNVTQHAFYAVARVVALLHVSRDEVRAAVVATGKRVRRLRRRGLRHEAEAAFLSLPFAESITRDEVRGAREAAEDRRGVIALVRESLEAYAFEVEARAGTFVRV